MYIATFYYWRPDQSWLVPDGQGVAFLEVSYGIGAGPYDDPMWTLVTGWTEHN